VDSVTEYRGKSIAEVDESSAAHARSVVEAGFVPVGFERRIEGYEHVLIVTWRYQPPPVLVRMYDRNHDREAYDAYARGAAEMAKAGYVPVTTAWGQPAPGVVKTVAFGLLAQNWRRTVLTVTYQFDPARTGPPTRSIPSAPAQFPPGPGPGWGSQR
jgi:hypothetical protein